MAKSICLFNNKGGVGKTTFLYHIAYCLAEKGKRVLIVDCDSQCNLTAYALTDEQIEESWKPDGNSIYRMIEPVDRTIGDIQDRNPTVLADRLFLIPGDLDLSRFEDRLGDTWNSGKGGSEPALRAQAAIFRAIRMATERCKADIVLIDLGPNLGAINRAVLSGTDLIIIPLAPDLFSIRGTENLGSKLVTWRQEWDQINLAWKGSLEIPKGKPQFLGYVVQQHNLRNNAAGMTRGWQLFGNRLHQAIYDNIVQKLAPLGQVYNTQSGNINLGQIPNLHSLIPYSQEARQPVFHCTSAHGLRGAHIEKAKESRTLFEPVTDLIIQVA